ncbi:MAG: methyl-accepting chemotaxis protein, partial [Myxococcales bacterium]|nr:methyl-accepting chemotaxis protein [Myxococcales bacterium]
MLPQKAPTMTLTTRMVAGFTGVGLVPVAVGCAIVMTNDDPAQVLTRTVIAGVLCVGLVVTLGTIAGRRFARPVQRMAEAAARLAAGDLDAKVACTRQDELGSLGRSLDGVAATLRTFNGELAGLAEHARVGDLTQRCDERGLEGAYRDVVRGANGIVEAFEAPLHELRDALRALSRGELHARIVGRYEGIYAELQALWNGSLGQLADALGEVAASSAQLDERSAQIRQSAHAIADGAAAQAATVEQISAQMAQMSQQTRGNAESADRAAGIAQAAAEAATRGDQAMSEMLEAMSGIEAAGKDISRVIKVIDEIA